MLYQREKATAHTLHGVSRRWLTNIRGSSILGKYFVEMNG